LKRLLFPLALAFATPAAAEPPVWVIRDHDSTIVLFGSVHLLPPGLYWRPDALEAALKKADDLWFELPIDGQSSMEAALLAVERGTLPKGETLTAKLSDDGRARLGRAAERLHIPLEALERMKPWLAEVTIGVAEIAFNGGNGSDGVERSLAADAPASARRRAFETADEQIAMFAGAPEKDQIASLEQTLRQMEDDPAAFGKLVDAWLDGDLATLEAQGLTPMRTAAPALYRRLVVERNARWTDTILKRLKGSGETVVVVGAAHLIGEDSVPAMLRKHGVAVEGP
jgi:uncharacterized protein YbaP (TraB family)